MNAVTLLAPFKIPYSLLRQNEISLAISLWSHDLFAQVDFDPHQRLSGHRHFG